MTLTQNPGLMLENGVIDGSMKATLPVEQEVQV